MDEKIRDDVIAHRCQKAYQLMREDLFSSLRLVGGTAFGEFTFSCS